MVSMYVDNGIVRSKSLAAVDGLIHGFSTRRWGDMRSPIPRQTFLSELSVARYPLYWKLQVHGDTVHVIDDTTDLTRLPHADGVIAIPTRGNAPHIVLTVRVADCVPILFVDPKRKTIAVAHAGWRGTSLGIGAKVVETMKRHASQPKDILVYIGPHIGPCCYTVSESRAALFRRRYPGSDDIVITRGSTTTLDLGAANVHDLLVSGITTEHIDRHPECTSSTVSRYYSYRKDTKESYGVMMGVLAWK